jgi:hypothetical protein
VPQAADIPGHGVIDVAPGGLKDADVEKVVRGVGTALVEVVARIGTSDRGSLAA